MKELSIIELKKICVEVLDNFTLFCNENNLKYYLAYGTLLGAVRHKGFIPWDDDIDVIMPREDYNRLLSLYKNSERYQIVSHEIEKEYYYPFAKMYDAHTKIIEEHFYCGIDLGIYIDIFPIDGNGNNILQAKKKFMKCEKEKRKLSHAFCKHFFKSNSWFLKEIIRYMRFLFIRIRGKEHYWRKLDGYTKATKSKENKYVANNVWSAYGDSEVMPGEWLENYIYADFEGKKYKIPEKYHAVLNQIYGDYMKLPAKENQISHHDMKMYWKTEGDIFSK